MEEKRERERGEGHSRSNQQSDEVKRAIARNNASKVDVSVPASREFEKIPRFSSSRVKPNPATTYSLKEPRRRRSKYIPLFRRFAHIPLCPFYLLTVLVFRLNIKLRNRVAATAVGNITISVAPSRPKSDSGGAKSRRRKLQTTHFAKLRTITSQRSSTPL